MVLKKVQAGAKECRVEADAIKTQVDVLKVAPATDKAVAEAKVSVVKNRTMANGKLYISSMVLKLNDRPVKKVEVIKMTDISVTFLTDYPVDEITVSREYFDTHFTKW